VAPSMFGADAEQLTPEAALGNCALRRMCAQIPFVSPRHSFVKPGRLPTRGRQWRSRSVLRKVKAKKSEALEERVEVGHEMETRGEG
jgi:hypothetical protein